MSYYNTTTKSSSYRVESTAGGPHIRTVGSSSIPSITPQYVTTTTSGTSRVPLVTSQRVVSTAYPTTSYYVSSAGSPLYTTTGGASTLLSVSPRVTGTTVSYSPLFPTALPLGNANFLSGDGLSASFGRVSTERRYEWQVGADGIMRRVCVYDSGITSQALPPQFQQQGSATVLNQSTESSSSKKTKKSKAEKSHRKSSRRQRSTASSSGSDGDAEQVTSSSQHSSGTPVAQHPGQTSHVSGNWRDPSMLAPVATGVYPYFNYGYVPQTQTSHSQISTQLKTAHINGPIPEPGFAKPVRRLSSTSSEPVTSSTSSEHSSEAAASASNPTAERDKIMKMKEAFDNTRQSRMKAAAEKIMQEQRRKALHEERKQRDKLEEEVQKLREDMAAKDAAHQQQLVQEKHRLEQEINKLKHEQDKKMKAFELEEAERKKQEADQRAFLEAEIARLRHEEVARMAEFERQLQQARTAAAQMQIKEQQNSFLNTSRTQQLELSRMLEVDRKANELVQNDDADYVAAIHPFRSLIIKLHSLSDFRGSLRELLEMKTPLSVRMVLGNRRLSVDTPQMASKPASEVRFSEVLNFPYANEKWLEVKLHKATSGHHQSLVAGVRLDMNVFVQNPAMCGCHEIQLLEIEGASPLATITMTIQLAQEFFEKAFISGKAMQSAAATPASEMFKATQEMFRTNMVKSSIANPYSSIRFVVSEVILAADQKHPEQLSCRFVLGSTSLESHRVSMTTKATENVYPLESEFCVPYDGERKALLEFRDHRGTVVAKTEANLETFLLTNMDAHNAMLAVNAPDDGRLVGSVKTIVEFCRDRLPTGPTVQRSLAENNSASQPSICPAAPPTNLLYPTGAVNAESSHHPGSLLARAEAGSSMLGAPSTLGLPSNFGFGSMLGASVHQLAHSVQPNLPPHATCQVVVISARNMMRSSKSRQDAYVRVVVDGKEASTPVAKDHGESAYWKASDATFTFDINREDFRRKAMSEGEGAGSARFEVYDKKKMWKDSLIGYAELPLVHMLENDTSAFEGDLIMMRVQKGEAIMAGLLNVSVKIF